MGDYLYVKKHKDPNFNYEKYIDETIIGVPGCFKQYFCKFEDWGLINKVIMDAFKEVDWHLETHYIIENKNLHRDLNQIPADSKHLFFPHPLIPNKYIGFTIEELKRVNSILGIDFKVLEDVVESYVSAVSSSIKFFGKKAIEEVEGLYSIGDFIETKAEKDQKLRDEFENVWIGSYILGEIYELNDLLEEDFNNKNPSIDDYDLDVLYKWFWNIENNGKGSDPEGIIFTYPEY